MVGVGDTDPGIEEETTLDHDSYLGTSQTRVKVILDNNGIPTTPTNGDRLLGIYKIFGIGRLRGQNSD